MLKMLKTRLNPVETTKNCWYNEPFIPWKTLQNLPQRSESAGEKSIPLVENLVVISTGVILDIVRYNVKYKFSTRLGKTMLKSVGNPGEKAQIINKWLGKIKKWPEL